MTNIIEYTYTTYKMPASQDITSGAADLVQAIAAELFPEDETLRGGKLWKIVHENKNYICGFVSNQKVGVDPSKEYFVTVEVGTDDKVHHVNCYKCTLGNLTNTKLIADYYGILKDDRIIFGFSSNNRFYNPSHSFFLEGAHEAFNDLPAGSYDATILELLNI